MRFIIVFVTLLFVTLCQAEGEATPSGARLLIEKKVLNKYLVESKDLIISYNIHNVGESAAVDVTIKDANLPEEYFQVVSGLSSFTIPRIAANSNVSHTVVYRPKTGVWGQFNFTSAEVNYLPREESQDVQIGFTSEPGEGYIVSLKEFDRRFSPHILDWFAFAVMSMPTLVIPFYLWFSSKSKYDAILAAKLEAKAAKKH
ncbi:translocon-associated protein subunit beta-like [Panonychus citri]|uniref:translocon-associated protein subunit beta-like n=1 Tax=Panonychus citri TaxID=50023 RepID=UPI002307C98B|nr:translocon-associated protein subunit beta-like [Panonychus citri]